MTSTKFQYQLNEKKKIILRSKIHFNEKKKPQILFLTFVFESGS
jgi:hypothetical protein